MPKELCNFRRNFFSFWRVFAEIFFVIQRRARGGGNVPTFNEISLIKVSGTIFLLFPS